MRILGMLTKYWQPGQVKTRLAADIGTDRAADLYRRFVQLLLSRLATSADRRFLAFSPHARRGAFERLVHDSAGLGHWELVRQATGDLGRRMEAFFRRTLEPGHRVVLIGSDSPTLTRNMLDEAFGQLEDRPVVLGPTLDGGYYLVGVRGGEVPPIFQGMDWSTESVFAATVERLNGAGIPFGTLPRWYDVDARDDLPRLANDLVEQIGFHGRSGDRCSASGLESDAAEALLSVVNALR